MLEEVRIALAYMNWGRWIVDCPSGCGNAAKLNPGQEMFMCSGNEDTCGQMSKVKWPAATNDITEALSRRPNRRNRNWFPAGHPIALATGAPVEQSPSALLDEQRVMENG